MGELLSSYIIRYLDNPQLVTGGVRVPLLVWTGNPDEAKDDSLILATRTGRGSNALAVGEPVVFEVRKDLGKANPFGMGVTLGRNENNDIILDHASISRFHAYFQSDGKT